MLRWSSLDRKVGEMKWVTRRAPNRGCDLGAVLVSVIIPLRPVEERTGQWGNGPGRYTNVQEGRMVFQRGFVEVTVGTTSCEVSNYRYG